MEYVRTILMNMNPFGLCAIHVATQMRTPIYHKTTFATL